MNKHLELARRLTRLLDTQFTVFGFKFGIDPFLDLLPGFGNILGLVTSCYLFWIAYGLHVPRWVYGKMAWHILLDYLLGILPIVGFVFDMFYRANTKNLTLLSQFTDDGILEGEIIDG
jgi:hypothetical protein